MAPSSAIRSGLFPLLLLPLLPALVSGTLCQPGCVCFDDGRDVRCDHANLTTLPYMLNPLLRSLSLVDAKLRTLDAASLSVYQDLEFLDLSSNSITELPAEFLVNFPRLRHVRLRGNKIRLISDDLFHELPSLEILDLSDNQIERIMPSAFAELSGLTSLNLSHNALSLLTSSAFTGLSGLSQLDLGHNRFERLQRDVFAELGDLAYLSLNDNRLRTLQPLTFNAQKKLVKLDLSGNGIDRVEEGTFSGLHSLKALDLRGNELSAVPARNWPYLAELEHLDLRSNQLSVLSAGAFEGLGSLRRLLISANTGLRRIEGHAFAGLFKLDSLEARDCPSLTTIDELAFEHPNRLASVDLANGGLSSLGVNLLNWRQLTRLDLAGNPLICDCELLRFLPSALAEVRHRANSSTSDPRPLCAGPEGLQGVAVETAPVSACGGLAEPTLLLAAMAASVAAVFLTVLVAAACLRSRAAEKHPSRAPLFTGASSCTDSLTYDKSDPLLVHHPTHYPTLHHGATGGFYAAPQYCEPGDYYASIAVHSPFAHRAIVRDDPTPYATGAICGTPRTLDYRLRPPSFMAPPPPPPTMPPPAPDPFCPVPSTEI